MTGKAAAALSCAFCILAANAAGQAAPGSPPPAGATPPLKAVLVLAPDLCATNSFPGPVPVTGIGEAACSVLGPSLKEHFPDLTTSTTVPSPIGDAQLILLPELGSCLYKWLGITHQSFDLEIEWTVEDRSGRIKWIGTSEGHSYGPIGHGSNVNKNYRELEQAAVNDAATHFAEELNIAPDPQLPAGPAAETRATNLPLPEAAGARTAAAPSNSSRTDPNTYTLEYVHSDKKWVMEGLGLDKKAKGTLVDYDSISPGLLSQVIVEMSRRGFARTAQSGGVCCRLKIGIEDVELAEFSWRGPQSVPGVKIAATVEVADAGNRTILKKIYTGQSNLTGTGFLIVKESVDKILQEAIAVLLRNAALDDEFNQALRSALANGSVAAR